MSDQLIRLIARQRISPEDLEEFKELARVLNSDTEKEDRGVLEHEFFVGSDGTECYINELYADSQGFLDHFYRLGPKLKRFNEVSSIVESWVLGDPTPEARLILERELKAKFFSPRHTGFRRQSGS
jgi:quinol monooxygenase YgiN